MRAVERLHVKAYSEDVHPGGQGHGVRCVSRPIDASINVWWVEEIFCKLTLCSGFAEAGGGRSCRTSGAPMRFARISGSSDPYLNRTPAEPPAPVPPADSEVMLASNAGGDSTGDPCAFSDGASVGDAGCATTWSEVVGARSGPPIGSAPSIL